MKRLPPPARFLVETLRTKLIPWAGSGAPIVLLGAPPQGVNIGRCTEKDALLLPLQRGNGQVMRVQMWPEPNLNALSMPHLGCVVEGEADLSVGVTTAMGRKLKIGGKRWTVAMPAGTFFIAAPGTPISAGGRVHWERENPETARYRILWINVHESGVSTHFSSPHNNRVVGQPYTFIHSTQILPLAQSLITELETQPPQYVSVSHLNLTLILNYMLRGLLTAPPLENMQQASLNKLPPNRDAANVLLKRTLDFIDENLKNSQLSAESIAENVHLSTVHLRRLFREEYNLPIMQFVTQQRMNLARQLLLQSSFTVNQIAIHCGYKHSASFINAFIKFHGESPVTFRSKTRDDHRLKIDNEHNQ